MPDAGSWTPPGPRSKRSRALQATFFKQLRPGALATSQFPRQLTARSGRKLTKPADETPDIERYTLRFNHLVARALAPDESRIMIAGLAERMA